MPPPPPPTGGGAGNGMSGDGSGAVALHDAAQSRYLNYALSVITSRALPDVRDGLKPVQRRILFTMWQQNLTADAKHRKCAKVVGDVMGSYHPHGDSSIYETLVRMAQPFSLRYPLIDGSGNFGSLDGDPRGGDALHRVPAGPHLRRAPPGDRPGDGAVPAELRRHQDRAGRAAVAHPEPARQRRHRHRRRHGHQHPAAQPHRGVPGADQAARQPRPVGGAAVPVRQGAGLPDRRPDPQLAGRDEGDLRTGSGGIRLRATWEAGPVGRAEKTIYVTSIPYTVDKSVLVERIGDVVLSRKLPHLLDVKDLSTDDVRIALELKRDADEKMVMAYLFKHTPLQTNFAVNLTCLVPTENAEAGRPERLDLKQMLWHFLHFRLEVVTSRLEHELEQLGKRIHILEGFAKVFDALDEIIAIIRKSDGKADAAEKIIKRFALDAAQTDAILELKLYRLARLEILVIQNELKEKRARTRQITALLKDDAARWKLVREELEEIQKKYGDPRRTAIEQADETEYAAEAFIVEEDNVVIVSRDGWVKRQKEVKDLSTTRLREGDSVLAAVAGSTRSTMVFFTNFGVAYTVRFVDVPASTGYGEPVQRLFKFKDNERVVAAFSLDPRAIGDIGRANAGGDDEQATIADADVPVPPVHALAVTSDGYSLRFSLANVAEPSTRAGRRYARPADGAEVVGVSVVTGDETVIAATRDARAMLCPASEVNFLAGPGKGVILIKLVGDDDRVLGFVASKGDRDLLTVETSRGAEQTVSTAKYEVTGRGGKGRELLQRGQFTRVVPTAAVLQGWSEES